MAVCTDTKTQIIRSLVLPASLYGCEIRSLNKELERQIKATGKKP